MSKVTKVVKTTRTTEVIDGGATGDYMLPHALWNVKIFFQGLLVGLMYGVFLYYFGMVSVISGCDECIGILGLITHPSIALTDMMSKLFLVNFDVNQVNFETVKGIFTRIAINVLFAWAIFYMIFVRFSLNVRTVHLVVLSILLSVFLGVSLFTLVSVTQGTFSGGFGIYIAEFIMICLIFTYAASIKFHLKTEATYKEIGSTLLSIVAIAALAILPLVKI